MSQKLKIFMHKFIYCYHPPFFAWFLFLVILKLWLHKKTWEFFCWVHTLGFSDLYDDKYVGTATTYYCLTSKICDNYTKFGKQLLKICCYNKSITIEEPTEIFTNFSQKEDKKNIQEMNALTQQRDYNNFCFLLNFFEVWYLQIGNLLIL